MTADEATEVLALAREWQAEASRDARSAHQINNRFLKLWIALNALYALRFDHLDGDHTQLRQFADWDPVLEAHRRGLDRHVYRRAVENLAAYGVYNYRRDTTIVVPEPYTSRDVLDAIYQIRCNLFHGRKSPSSLRDARLVQSACRIIVHLVNSLLADDSIWDDAADQ